jgi:small subunit ribosomal protein S20
LWISKANSDLLNQKDVTFEEVGRLMAHHKSAQKRIRQTETRTAINRSRISRIRTFIKRVEKAVEGGDQTAAQQAFKEAQPEIMRGVSKGVLKLGTASRKVSRLSARVKALGSSA